MLVKIRGTGRTEVLDVSKDVLVECRASVRDKRIKLKIRTGSI